MSGSAKIAANARAIAALLDTFPSDLEAPSHHEIAEYHTRPVLKWLMFDDGDGQRGRAAAIVRALGGVWDKSVTGDYFRFKRQDPSGVDLEIVVNREQVCTARVVGTETVTKQVPVAFEAVTETVDVVEWECAPLLAAVADPFESGEHGVPTGSAR